MTDISSSALDTFIDQLVKEKFTDAMPDESSVASIKKELTERLNKYLTLRTIEIISTANPEALQKLSDLIKTNPVPEQIQGFISQYVKEPDILVAQILTDFRTLYLGVESKPTN